MLPNNNNDPVTLSWSKPDLTDDNKGFFQGYNVSITRTVFNTTFSQRRKRNIPPSESQTIRLGLNDTNYTYNDSCPYSDRTLCPYSQYCFSIVSIFAFRGIPIDASDPTLTARCTNTTESGELIIFVYTLMLCCVIAPSGPPQELNVTDIDIHEIGIVWKFPQFPNGVITGFTVSMTTLYVTIVTITLLSGVL